MTQIKDAPYHEPEPVVCPRCGEDIGNYVYTTDEGDMCSECFAEYIKDCLETNPQLVAEAFGIAYRYTG